MHGSARGDRQSISRANAKKVRHGLSIGFIAYFAAQDCATVRQALSGARREAARSGRSHVEPVLSLDPPIGRSPRRSARGAVGFFPDKRRHAGLKPARRPVKSAGRGCRPVAQAVRSSHAHELLESALRACGGVTRSVAQSARIHLQFLRVRRVARIAAGACRPDHRRPRRR